MCGVDLDHARANRETTARRIGKRTQHVRNPRLVERDRSLISCFKCNSARRKNRTPTAVRDSDAIAAFPGRARARFAARVSELHGRNSTLRFDEAEDAREHLDVFVFPNPEIVGADTTFRRNRRRFRHHHCRTTHGARPEMHEMPIIGEAVFAGIFAHGRDANAIAEFHVAEFEWREEMGGLVAHGVVEVIGVRRRMGFDQYHEPVDELSQKTRTFARMIASLTEEAEAINWYEQRISVEKDSQAKAIMKNAQKEEFKHFGMDLEFLLRQKPIWREILKGILFQSGDIVKHGEEAEEEAD